MVLYCLLKLDSHLDSHLDVKSVRYRFLFFLQFLYVWFLENVGTVPYVWVHMFALFLFLFVCGVYVYIWNVQWRGMAASSLNTLNRFLPRNNALQSAVLAVV